MLEEKRKQIEAHLRTKFKEDIDIEIYWRNGFNGNQIIGLNIGAFTELWGAEVELDKMLFYESTVEANVDLILMYTKRAILNIFFNN
jgi:hypothetical protein